MRNILLCSLILATASCSSTPEEKADAKAETPIEKKAEPTSTLDNTSTQKLANVVESYYNLKDAFVKSDSTDAAAKAKDVEVAVTNFLSGLQGTTPPAGVKEGAEAVKIAAAAMAATKPTATTLDAQRAGFETVSDKMTALLKSSGWKGGTYQQFCPMAFNDKGAHWLSNSDEIRNPYFGDRMLECGEVTDSL